MLTATRFGAELAGIVMAEIRAIAASSEAAAVKQRRLSFMGDKVVAALSSAGEARRLDGMNEHDAAKWMEAAQLGYDEAFAAARNAIAILSAMPLSTIQ